MFSIRILLSLPVSQLGVKYGVIHSMDI